MVEGRPGYGLLGGMRTFRGHFGLQLGHDRDHRVDVAPRNGQGRVRRTLFCGNGGCRWDSGHHHSAVNHLYCLRIPHEPPNLGALRGRDNSRRADGGRDAGGLLDRLPPQWMGLPDPAANEPDSENRLRRVAGLFCHRPGPLGHLYRQVLSHRGGGCHGWLLHHRWPTVLGRNTASWPQV